SRRVGTLGEPIAAPAASSVSIYLLVSAQGQISFRVLSSHTLVPAEHESSIAESAATTGAATQPTRQHPATPTSRLCQEPRRGGPYRSCPRAASFDGAGNWAGRADKAGPALSRAPQR
ncbi:MAG: hypothetical protein LBE08_02055, partial [Bifidobacteriaceae bacterium]|nr:hypothetical protein [Bifidobacteriaceae bacterium]